MVKDTSKLATAIVFAFIADYVFNIVYHGNLMMADYAATSILWRSDEEMGSLYGICLAAHLIMISVIGLIFAKGYEGKGYIEGFRFGLLIGLLLSALNMVSFVHMPIPANILQGWVFGSLLEGQVIGLSLALIYGLNSKAKPAAKPATKKTTKKK